MKMSYHVDALKSVNECRTVMQRLKAIGDQENYNIVFQRYCELASLQYDDTDDPLVKEFYQVLIAYEQLLTEKNQKTTKATRTRQKISNKGVVNSLIEWGSSINNTPGFEFLVANGLINLTAEALILRYKDRFPKNIVANSKAKLNRILEKKLDENVTNDDNQSNKQNDIEETIERTLSSSIDIELLSKNTIQQCIKAKRSTFVNEKYGDTFETLFEEKETIYLSRSNVFEYFRKDFKIGILAAYAWGFPTGGRGKSCGSLIENYSKICEIFKSINAMGLSKEYFYELNSINYINYATTTKFLYFGGINIDGYQCLIFDKMVKDYIVEKKPKEYAVVTSSFGSRSSYGIEFETYRSYVIETHEAAKRLGGFNGDALELYFFENSPSRRRAVRYTNTPKLQP